MHSVAPIELMNYLRGWEERSERCVADDSGALHLSNCGPVVLHRVMLCRTVVPDRDAVLGPAPPNLILGNLGLTGQVGEQVSGAGGVIDSVADILGRVIVHEVRGKRVDEKNLLAGLRMCSYHGMFGVGKAFPQLVALFDRHPSAEGRLDTVPGTQVLDLLLDPRRQILVGECHVHPNRVAADRRCFHTTQYTSHGRVDAPGGVAVIRILEVLRRAVQVFVDADQARMVGITAQSWMILQFTESLGKFYVLGFGEVLVAKKQDLVL